MLRKFVVASALVLGLACASSGPLRVDSRVLLTQFVSKGFGEEPVPLGGSSHLEYFPKLMAVAERHGVKVFAAENLNEMGFLGLYVEQLHAIYLNTELSNNGATAVLAHELAHVLMQSTIKEPEADIIAQGVAYVVMGRLGLDISDVSFFYYKQLASKNLVQSTLMRYSSEIDRVANQILSEMPK